MPDRYNYIITGAGCAGLSLLTHLLQHPFFAHKTILLIDKDAKQSNDRTWCFWEEKAGLFEDIVYHRWKQLDFFSHRLTARYNIAPYEYKMIRGIDFYHHVFALAQAHPNVCFVQDEVVDIQNDHGAVRVTTAAGSYVGNLVFNSILFNPQKLMMAGSLLQHFKGWFIETPHAAFDPTVTTFMDFRPAAGNANSFVYMLPLSSHKALVEYTVFSPSLLEPQAYTAGLQQYLTEYLHLPDYAIAAEEFGVIPMSTFPFEKGEGHIIQLGTAGGQTKSSSGFTFQFIQKHSAALAAALIKGEDLLAAGSILDNRFDLYDKVLLNILYQKKSTAADIFTDLFSKNKPQQIFKFLDNETTLREELRIMRTVSWPVFLPAVLKQLMG